MYRQTHCHIETDGQTATNTIRQTLILADTYRLRGRAKIGPSVSKNKKIRSELTWKVLPLETIFSTQILLTLVLYVLHEKRFSKLLLCKLDS